MCIVGLYLLLFFVPFVLCFFFFKQKTAYEMRISDWSSDVCSSDLIHGGERAALRLRVGHRAHRVARRLDLRRLAVARIGFAEHEIGRASCRERVCQYV